MTIDVANIQHLKMQDPQDIYEIIQKIFYGRKDQVDLMKEHLWAISLNNALNVLNLELVSIGTKNRTIADPGDVFRVPLYKSSSYVALVHNHPSGSLEPSKADLDLTNKFMKAGELLDIPVVEHIIVTAKSYFSFRMAGLIEQLKRDDKYALTFVYKKKMEKKMDELKASVEREKRKSRLEGEEKRNREIAKQMLLKGMDTKTIQEITGLSEQWIGHIKSDIEKSNLPE